VPAEDAQDPKRTIPRATIIGTAVTVFVYLLGTVAVMGILPAATLAGSGAPFADAAESAFGGRAGAPVVGLVVSSALVTALTMPNYNASLVDQFTFVVLLATLSTLVPYVLLVTGRARFEAKRLAGHATVAGLALAYAIWTVAGWRLRGRLQRVPADPARHPGLPVDGGYDRPARRARGGRRGRRAGHRAQRGAAAACRP